MSRLVGACTLLALVAIPRVAVGDELSATLSQPLTEVSHSVDLRIEGGTAIYVVRRTFANTGERADEAQLDIDLPMGAAVTGLRIRARDRWYDAELMEADEAADKYRELTSLGAWEPKDPALLQWVWADHMHLQVFPVMPRGTSTVEYTLTAPLHYRQGRYVLSYPRVISGDDDGLKLATPVIRIEPGHGDAMTPVRIDGDPVAPETPVVLGPPVRPRWIGEGEPNSGVGYAWSSLEVTQPGPARSARLTVAIDHTYRGDLSLWLVEPGGTHVFVDDLDGSENDVHETFDVELPEGTEARGTWHLMAADGAGLDVGTIDGWGLTLAESEDPKAHEKARAFDAVDVPVFIPDAPSGDSREGLALIEIEAPPIDHVDTRYGRVFVDDETHFVRLELDAAPEIEPLPKGASVVFVVDASRSAHEVDEQLGLARGYLTHVPDAKAEIVLFRRFAERVTGTFSSPDDLWAAVQKAETDGRLEPGNGSAMDEGLRLAGEALRGRRGPRRIVVLTDARLRSRFTTKDGVTALRAAPRRTIAHVVVPTGDGYETRIVRDDAHPLASIPAASGGVLFGLEGGSWSEAKALERASLGLVRPISIDDFTIEGIDLTFAPEPPDVLHEGTSYGFMMSSADSPRRFTVSGKIWGRDFEHAVVSSRRYGDATAAFVFSEDEHHDLTPEQMMMVAMRGRAVSPVTSYLAIEPGVRPSTIGLEGIGRGGGGSGEGTIGLGTTGLIGKGGGGGNAKRWTLEELMEPGVVACVAAHRPAADWSVSLDVETTSREIVDVEAKAGPTAMARCLVEAAWAVELTWNFRSERETRSVTLP